MKDNNFNSTKAQPTSRKKIRNFAMMLRENFLSDPNGKIDIIDFLEITSDVLGISYEIVQDKDLPDNYAETDLNNRLIRFRESVYIGAEQDCPRDRFTVAHEIGHCLLHAVKNGVKLCRKDEEIKYKEKPNNFHFWDSKKNLWVYDQELEKSFLEEEIGTLEGEISGLYDELDKAVARKLKMREKQLNQEIEKLKEKIRNKYKRYEELEG